MSWYSPLDYEVLDTMTRIARVIAIAACFFLQLPTIRASADPVDDGFRLSVDTPLFGFERVAQSAGGSTVTYDRKVFSLFDTALGVSAGWVFDGTWFVGARTRMQYQGADGSGSFITWAIEPTVEGMLDLEGPIRPFAQLGGTLGGITDRSPGNPTDRNFQGGLLTFLGIHAFVIDSLSIDPAVMFAWTRVTGDGVSGKLNTYTVGLSLSISGWVARDRHPAPEVSGATASQ